MRRCLCSLYSLMIRSSHSLYCPGRRRRPWPDRECPAASSETGRTGTLSPCSATTGSSSSPASKRAALSRPSLQRDLWTQMQFLARHVNDRLQVGLDDHRHLGRSDDWVVASIGLAVQVGTERPAHVGHDDAVVIVLKPAEHRARSEEHRGWKQSKTR